MGQYPGIMVGKTPATSDEFFHIRDRNPDDVDRLNQQQLPVSGFLETTKNAGDGSALWVGVVNRIDPQSAGLGGELGDETKVEDW